MNWTRRSSSPSTVPSVSTSFVFASPGTPTSSPWPPDSTVISASSTTEACPNTTVPIAARAAATRSSAASAARAAAASSEVAVFSNAFMRNPS